MIMPLDLDEMKMAGLRADPHRAVTEEGITCLLCGGTFRQLTNTHLRGHGMAADEYKRHFGYNRRRALMCGALRRVYAERAVRTDLASRIGWRPIVQEPELRRLGGMRPTTLEERLTRAERRILGAGPRGVADAGARTTFTPIRSVRRESIVQIVSGGKPR
jgi:hypothetical protein